MVPWIWMLNNKKKSSSGISAALHSSLWNFWQICFLTIGFSQNQCVKIRIHCLLLYKKIPKIWDFMEVCFQCGGHSHLLIHFVLASSPVLRAKKILCNLKNWFFSHECCYRNLLSLLGSEERHPFFGAVKTQVSQSVSQSVSLGGVIIAIEFFKTRFLWAGDGIFPEIWRPSESSVGDTLWFPYRFRCDAHHASICSSRL